MQCGACQRARGRHQQWRLCHSYLDTTSHSESGACFPIIARASRVAKHEHCLLDDLRGARARIDGHRARRSALRTVCKQTQSIKLWCVARCRWCAHQAPHIDALCISLVSSPQRRRRLKPKTSPYPEIRMEFFNVIMTAPLTHTHTYTFAICSVQRANPNTICQWYYPNTPRDESCDSLSFPLTQYCSLLSYCLIRCAHLHA